MIVVLYYSLSFIFALFMIGRLVVNKNLLSDVGDKTKRSFFNTCIAFIAMCILNVIIGVSSVTVLDGILLYVCEFLKFGILINGAELCAIVTDKRAEEKKTIYRINSELAYVCIVVLFIRTVLEHSVMKHGLFGDQLVCTNYLGIILYIILYVLILFMYAAYTYLFYHLINKKREIYIFQMCTLVVGILAVCLFIEAVCYISLGEFVPAMNIGIPVVIYVFKRIIEYRRSIEYNENDYQAILAPSYKTPSFVCNDNGEIIFENIRAFVMQQTYKDNYVGKYITDVFEMSEYDRDRLEDARVKQEFDIYCKYSREKNEILLKAKHNIDRYGEIFSTELKYYVLDDETLEIGLENDEKHSAEISAENAISIQELYQLRLDSLLSLLENQELLYKKDERQLFIINLKGIIKLSSKMNMPSIEDLCSRIDDIAEYRGEWGELEALIVELDRHYETLKLIR